MVANICTYIAMYVYFKGLSNGRNFHVDGPQQSLNLKHPVKVLFIQNMQAQGVSA